MPSLLGSKPNQVSTNGDLGTLAFQDASNPKVGTVVADGLTVDTTTLVVDSVNDRVGIGTASPASRLDVSGAGVVTTILSTNNSNVLRLRGNNATDGVYLGTVGNAFTISNGAAVNERMRITDAGIVEIAQGQIKFPATQVASSDANTLDDYEEGTWTPTIAPSAGSLTAYSSEGKYVKIGQTLTLFGAFTITTAGTSSGFASLGGIPFTSMSSSLSNRSAVGVVRENAATGNIFQIYINSGATTGDILTLTNGAITWTNGFTYIFTLTYRTSA
jgi:hypothetical protein